MFVINCIRKMLRFLLLISFIKVVFGANILFLTVLPSPSHDIWNRVLVVDLLARGHSITLLGSTDTHIASNNYTFIQLDEDVSFDEPEDFMLYQYSLLQELQQIWPVVVEICEGILKSTALETILEYPKDKFDLIVFDVSNAHCLYPLIQNFGNPPAIGISPFSIPPYIADAFGHHYYSYYPVYLLPYSHDMTFLQRILNTVIYATECYLKWQTMPVIHKMVQERFGQNAIPLDEVERQFSLLLANHDPILDYSQPLPPHIIPVGGLHATQAGKLSKELQIVLDGANHGAIYFSFGSNIVPSWFPKEKKQMLLSAFSKLKQIVLWKYDGEDLENIPKNVVIQKWYPQNDILGHRNVKLFVTHCGALSMQEAMYHGVPLIGIPFFMDQHVNAAKIEAKVVGKALDNNALTQEALSSTIQEVLTNPIYMENMQNLSKMFRDQPQTPLERAMFWIEYVLKHKDVSDLSPKGRYMTHYQRENMDILGFFLLCVLILIISLYVIIKSVVNMFVGKVVKVKTS